MSAFLRASRRDSLTHDGSSPPRNQHRAQSLMPVGAREMWAELKSSSEEWSLRSTTSPAGLSISVRELAPLINKPGITFTPGPCPLLPLPLSVNSSSLTNPSFQEREADLFWGRASGAVCVGTTSGCHSQGTMGSERQGGEFSMQDFPA